MVHAEGEPESSSSEAASEEAAGPHPYLGPSAGCTAVVALVRGDKLYVANAGDSRCVASHNGHAVALTHDHKPTDAPEHDRIMKVSPFRCAYCKLAATGKGLLQCAWCCKPVAAGRESARRLDAARHAMGRLTDCTHARD